MDKSLFILGAGASKDFSKIFPTGVELIKEINYHFITETNLPYIKIDETSTDNPGIHLSALINDLNKIIPDKNGRYKKIKNVLWKLQLHYEHKYLRTNDIIPLSIDYLVSEQIKKHFDNDDKKIIQCCIYYLIKGFEQAKSEQKGFQNNWIYNLAGKIAEFEVKDIVENIHLVIFNYDRIFEEYFFKYLLCNNVDIDRNEFIKNNIHHVYGSLGDLNEVPFKEPNDK